MVEPCKGKLVLRDVTVETKNSGWSFHKRKSKTIVNKASLGIDGGQLTAVCGLSGSGKSTLVEVILDRRPDLAVSGHRSIVGNQTYASALKSSVLVPQQEVFLQKLTARETLFYRACMMGLESDKAHGKVDQVMRNMQFSGDVPDTIVEKLSGGEKKRLSIGLELLSSPMILVLDEPTSGLDLDTAIKVVRVLQRIAETTGMIVICVVHDTSQYVIQEFSRLVFLEHTGRIAFNGTIDELREFMIHIRDKLRRQSISRGDFFECEYLEPEHNIAEGFILTIAAARDDTWPLADNWETYKSKRLRPESLPRQRKSEQDLDILKTSNMVRAIAVRSILVFVFDYSFVLRSVSSMIVGLLIGSIFDGVETGSRATVASISIMLFFVSLWLVIQVIIGIAFILLDEKEVISREIGNRHFRGYHGLYFTVRLSVLLAQEIIYTGLLILGLKFYSNLPMPSFMQSIVLLSTAASCVPWGFAIGFGSRSLIGTIGFVLLFLFLSILFSGNLVAFSDLPPFLRALYFSNVLQQHYSLLLIYQFNQDNNHSAVVNSLVSSNCVGIEDDISRLALNSTCDAYLGNATTFYPWMLVVVSYMISVSLAYSTFRFRTRRWAVAAVFVFGGVGLAFGLRTY